MIFRFQSNSGAILASLFLVAFVGNLDLLSVSAEQMSCDISIDISTWEDKTLSTKEIPVPNNKLLKYGIGAVISEKFDVNADVGTETWLASNKFQSYQMKPVYTPTALDDADADDSVDYDASSAIALPDPSSKSRLRRGLGSNFMPKHCWRSYKCQSEFMKRYVSRIMMRGRIDTNPGMCRWCSIDDDVAHDDAALGMVRELTLDQLVGNVSDDEEQDSSSLKDKKPLHVAFEKDVCLELTKFNKAYSSFETSERCKIKFHCRPVEDGELDEESKSELVIVDHRDIGEGNDDGFLYSVTASP
jgi:hypothetical protein